MLLHFLSMYVSSLEVTEPTRGYSHNEDFNYYHNYFLIHMNFKLVIDSTTTERMRMLRIRCIESCIR